MKNQQGKNGKSSMEELCRSNRNKISEGNVDPPCREGRPPSTRRISPLAVSRHTASSWFTSPLKPHLHWYAGR